MRRSCLRVLSGVGFVLLCVPSTMWAQAVAPPLGTAAAFGALGNSAVTGAAGLGVVVTGEVGSSPTPTISNFPPSTTAAPFTTHFANDFVVQQARIDSIAAYNALLIQGTGIVEPDNMATIVGPLTPGIYSFTLGAPDLPVNAVLTLNDPTGTGIFVFNVGSTLTANVGSSIAGTANPCNIYWRVGTSATLNGVNFRGTVIANASITLGSGSNEQGRLLAGIGATGAVTMAGNGGNTIGGCSIAGAGVPTLPEWAVVALAGFLALAGLVTLGKRQAL
jgi:hypothetical protein